MEQGGVLWGVEGTTVGSLATGSIANSSVFSTFTTTPLHFGINQVVKMTIDSSGNVGIGTTSPTTTGGSAGGSITLNSNSATSSAGVIIMANAASKSYVYWNSTYGMLLQNQNADKWTFYNGSGEAANISATGAYSQVSDGRLKHSVTTIDSDMLDRVLELRPVTYIFNSDEENTLQIGFIAQEVQALFPDLVSVGVDQNHTLSLNYTGLIPYVVKGMQEMDITIQALPQFEDDGSLAAKIADFLRGIAERGEAMVDSVKTKDVDTENIQTDTLCVGAVCVSEDAFLQMVQNAGADSSSSGGGTPDPAPEEEPPAEDLPAPDEGGPAGPLTEEPPAEELAPEPEPDPLPEPNPEPQAPAE